MLDMETRIEKASKKYRAYNYLSWLSTKRDPLVETRSLFEKEMNKLNQTIKDKQSIISEVKIRIEPEIIFLSQQLDYQSKLQAKALTISLSKELIKKLKEVQDFLDKKEIEIKAYEKSLKKLKNFYESIRSLFFFGGAIIIGLLLFVIYNFIF